MTNRKFIFSDQSEIALCIVTPFIIQAVSLSFIIVSIFFTVILFKFIPHFNFFEILEFRYPKFYNFIFGQRIVRIDINETDSGKLRYFKVYVLVSIAIIRFIFLFSLYYFSQIYGVNVPLLTPFTVFMGIFGAFIFEITIIQFFVYLGFEFFMEFTFIFRFAIEHIITKSNGVMYSMLTLMRDLNSGNSFKQRNNSITRSTFNTRPKLMISYPLSHGPIFGPRFGSIDWSNHNSVESFLKDPYYLIHRRQKKLPIIFGFTDFKLPKFNTKDITTDISKIRNLIEVNNSLINITGYIEIGVRNPKDLEIFKKDLGARNYIDSELKKIDKNLSICDFIDFVESISNKTAEYDFVTKDRYLLSIRSSLIEHFPKIFTGNNWVEEDPMKFLKLLDEWTRNLADQSCVLTVFEKVYFDSKIMPVPDVVNSNMLVSRNVNLYEGGTKGVRSAIGDFIMQYFDGRNELIESKFRSAERANMFLINLGSTFLNIQTRSVTFLEYALSMSLNHKDQPMFVINNKLIDFPNGFGPLGISILSKVPKINLEAFIDDLVRSCNKDDISYMNITHTFDDFYQFFSVDKFMEEWVKVRNGSIEYSGDYAIVTLDPICLVELEIKELYEYSNKLSNFVDSGSDAKTKVKKRIENLEIYKNFFVYLNSSCLESGKKIDCTIRLILRVKN